MRFTPERGVAFFEYMVLFLVVTAGLAVMAGYLQRGYQGQMRKGGEGFGFLRQFDLTKSHDCVYEGQVWFTDSKTNTASSVNDVMYSQACYDHKIMNLQCAQSADSDNCFSYAKTECGKGYACAPRP